jgi:hypothetical protein
MSEVRTNELLQKIIQLLQENSVAIGKQELTLVNGTAVGLTIPIGGAKSALIQVESTETTNPVVRFWEDGSTPTASSGMFRLNGDFLDVITAANLSQFRVIGIAGTTKLQITFYK